MKQRNRYHATEINKANEELASANLTLSNQAAGLEERIRALESACEAALKMMRFLLEHRHAFISGYRYEIEKEVEQLEEAIKHG